MYSLGFHHNPTAKQDFTRQRSSLRYQQGGMIAVDPAETYAAARRAHDEAQDAAARTRNFMQRASPILAWGGEPMPTKAPPQHEVMPAWVTLNDKVLRFQGYCEEEVQESQIETRRVRRIELFYYIEDDSLQVSEPRQANSGMPQGLVIKRHRVPHPSPESPERLMHTSEVPPGSALALKRTPLAPRYYTFRDFQVGRAVVLYGRRYMLTDADPWTKEFYAETLGSPLDAPQPVPADPYQEQRKLYERDEDRPPNRTRDAFTKYMESRMGIKATRSGDDPAKISKYIQNQGRVLRFYGTWEDKAMFGRKHKLKICYYLCDDTIEVLEIPGANSGMTMTAGGTEVRLVKRSQLPKNPKEVQLVPGGYAPRPKDKMERANAAEDRLLHGQATGEVLLQALADKLNKKTNNIRPIFRSFDENKDGTVSYAEFRRGLQTLGFQPSDEQYEELLRVVDEDGSGYIDYVEFYQTIRPLAEDDTAAEEGAPTIGNTGVAQVPFIHWHDLRPGVTLDCFGKMVLIEDADAFTKRFYHLNHAALEPLPPKSSKKSAPMMEVPPHPAEGTVGSIGEPEDSLQNCLHLVAKAPKGPRQDLSRFMSYEGDTLRFEAVLADCTEPTDVDRKFIISYYIRDFTLAVYEPPMRNSGVIGGQFLKRQRVAHPDQAQARKKTVREPAGAGANGYGEKVGVQVLEPRYYEPQHMFIGAKIVVHHQPFFLFKCDLATLNYMEKNRDKFPLADGSAAVEHLSGVLAEAGVDTGRLAAELRARDAVGSGTLDVMGLKASLASLNAGGIVDQQLIAMVRKFDRDGSGMLVIDRFVEAVCGTGGGDVDYGSAPY